MSSLAAGCAPFQPETLPSPAGPAGPDTGARIARDAIAQVGAVYRTGGASPVQGFDCSGLVAYVLGEQGIQVPRTAAQQFAAARPILAGELRPGDLVFFRLVPPSREVTHVGIYTGQGRFVHAPKSGKRVCETPLDDEYFRGRIAGYGRFGTP
jgi:cell wall-associated NlpC family hydrolase